MTAFDDRQIAMIQTLFGRGYKGYEYYARATSMTQPLFDLQVDQLDQYVEINDLPNYSSNFFNGKTQKEYFNSLSTSIGLQFPYEGFAFEVNASFSGTVDSNSTNEFFNYTGVIIQHRISFKVQPPLLKTFKQALNGDPEELFKTYGTHYLRSILVGARISFLSHISSSTLTESTDLKAVAQAAADESLKGHTSVENVNKKAVAEALQNRTFFVGGGDPAKASDIIDQKSGDLSAQYQAWVETVKDYPSIADFGGSEELIPIYKLAEDVSRREELKKAWQDYLREKTGKIVDAKPPEAILRNAAVNLMTEDGRYLVAASSGILYYYAFLGSDAMPHKFGGSDDLLVHQSNVPIITTQCFEDTAFSESSESIYLGAFGNSTELYYWQQYGSKSNWIIEKVDTTKGTTIHYGDEVYIKNEAYQDQYLKPANDNYLTTQEHEKYKWQIVKPK